MQKPPIYALILGCTTTGYLISSWASSTLIILFSEMLKCSRNYFSFSEILFSFLKENKESD
jgi:hypothetical protein